MRRPNPTQLPDTSRESGFTLVELLVSIVVVVEVLLAVLMLVDFSSRLSRAQSNVSDMQQSLRGGYSELASDIRMAGAGGLPMRSTAPGGAVWATNNATASQRIGGGTTPEVLDGTDVLIVRGVFSTPLFHIDPKLPTTFSVNNANPALATTGWVQILSKTSTQIPQPLTPLIEAVQKRRPEALLLISPRDSRIYSVVELDPANSNVTDVNNIRIAFFTTGGTYANQYRQFAPTGTFNPNMDRVAFVGLLEEHRFYIREEYAIAGNTASDLNPKLARARTYPGVDAPWRDNPVTDTSDPSTHANWKLDIADNILDLQVALGFDTTNGGGSMIQDTNSDGNDDLIIEAANGQNDDWLYNSTNDNRTDVIWTNAALHYVRVNLLARTDRRDNKYQAPNLTRIEDRLFTTTHAFNVREQRMFRRRVLQNLFDLRNL